MKNLSTFHKCPVHTSAHSQCAFCIVHVLGSDRFCTGIIKMQFSKMYVFGTFSLTKHSIKLDEIGYYSIVDGLCIISARYPYPRISICFYTNEKNVDDDRLKIQNWLYERSTGMKSKKQSKIHDSLGSKNWTRYGF